MLECECALERDCRTRYEISSEVNGRFGPDCNEPLVSDGINHGKCVDLHTRNECMRLLTEGVLKDAKPSGTRERPAVKHLIYQVKSGSKGAQLRLRVNVSDWRLYRMTRLVGETQ